MKSEVHAAGGLVTRTNAGGETEVLVVHRPRYDDWSLPKGKLHDGEAPEAGALREVAEETGVRCRLGEEVAARRYVDRRGRPKLVRFWTMTPVGTAEWSPNDEVDEVRWVPAAAAARLLTYDADRALVEDVTGRKGAETPR